MHRPLLLEVGGVELRRWRPHASDLTIRRWRHGHRGRANNLGALTGGGHFDDSGRYCSGG